MGSLHEVRSVHCRKCSRDGDRAWSWRIEWAWDWSVIRINVDWIILHEVESIVMKVTQKMGLGLLYAHTVPDILLFSLDLLRSADLLRLLTSSLGDEIVPSISRICASSSVIGCNTSFVSLSGCHESAQEVIVVRLNAMRVLMMQLWTVTVFMWWEWMPASVGLYLRQISLRNDAVLLYCTRVLIVWHVIFERYESIAVVLRLNLTGMGVNMYLAVLLWGVGTSFLFLTNEPRLTAMKLSRLPRRLAWEKESDWRDGELDQSVQNHVWIDWRGWKY